MARKGQFKKGGGRVGDHAIVKYRAPAKKRKKRAASYSMHNAAVAHASRTRVVEVPVAVRRKSSKSRHGSGGITLGKVIGAAVVLGSVAETDKGPLGATIYNWVQKLPGTKTLGGAVTTGLYCGAIHKFTKFGGKFRPLLAAAGLVGVVGAGLKLGTAGMNFKWLGDYGGGVDNRMSFSQ